MTSCFTFSNKNGRREQASTSSEMLGAADRADKGKGALIGGMAALGLIRNVDVDWSAEKLQANRGRAHIGTLPKIHWIHESICGEIMLVFNVVCR